MKFFAPENIGEAVKLKAANPSYRLVAGGSDVCVLLNAGKISPDGLISLRGIAPLRAIEETKDRISIGALATHSAIAANSLVEANFPALVKACRTVGASQIQNVGTIGGNVANASPAGDTLPVLLAYDAVVVAGSVRGEREIKFGELFTGYRKLSILPDEIITKFIIPKRHILEVSDFYKVGARRAQAISKVMGCFAAHLDGKAILSVALAFGSVAATPIRLAKTETMLMSRKFTSGAIEEACEIAKSEFEPLDDIRSTADYRRHLVSVMIRRFLSSL